MRLSRVLLLASLLSLLAYNLRNRWRERRRPVLTVNLRAVNSSNLREVHHG